MRDPDGGGRRGVLAALASEVGRHLAQAQLVAQHDGRARRRPGDRPVGLHGPGVGDGVGGDDGQVDRLALERPALVEAGQQQQVVDEDAHAGRLLLDPAHGHGQVGRTLGRPPAEQLGVAPDGGQRRAQLVGGVADEAAQALLGGLPGLEGASRSG